MLEARESQLASKERLAIPNLFDWVEGSSASGSEGQDEATVIRERLAPTVK